MTAEQNRAVEKEREMEKQVKNKLKEVVIIFLF